VLFERRLAAPFNSALWAIDVSKFDLKSPAAVLFWPEAKPASKFGIVRE
jgi:hypothetical protein